MYCMLSRATLNQLRIFDAAARHLHFGRAAAELNLTQPAVSIQLRQLESVTGVALFEQIGRRMHLTASGKAVLEHARGVLEQLRLADETIGALKGSGGGELHVAATTTSEYFAPHLLAEFRRAHGGARIRLTISNREMLVRALGDNTVDLAVMGQAPAELDTVAAAFARHPLAIVAAPDHPLARKRRIRLDQVAGETFLIRERGSGTRTTMERAFAAQDFAPADMIEFGSNESIKQAVAAGMGLGFISLHTVGLELAARRLAVLPVAGMPVMRDWYAVHRGGKRLTAVAGAFKTYLVERGAAAIDRALS